MKKSSIIISVIAILILAILGVSFTYGKYQAIESKSKEKLKTPEVESRILGSDEILVENDNKTTKSDNKNESDEIAGRIEIAKLNIKEDLLSSQIKYTTSGLNELGNSVVYLENTQYAEITKDTEIYIRNAEQGKAIYKVYDIYETNIEDTSFYTRNTEQIELTLIVKQGDNVLVIQARKQ